MPLVCPYCGENTVANPERSSDSTRCANCGKAIPTHIFPLFVVTGASGSGKTAVVPELRCTLRHCVVFDKDLLWGRCGNWEQFYNNWLRIAYSIAQGGRYTVIAGIIMPGDFDSCEDRGLIGPIYYVNLHCDDAVREQRIRARPAWRQSTNEWFIQEQRRVAAELLTLAPGLDPPMYVINTSAQSTAATAASVVHWATTILKQYPRQKPSIHSATD
ncbi:MAG: nucleoside kinase [Anaerolineae bacterium]|nr:nucleoside kinase [Anaerolineae bacterium]